MKQDRCPYCGRWFKAVCRKGARQITCGGAKCQAAHKRELDRTWREKDPGWVEQRQEKVRRWAKSRDYWKKFRAQNPAYVKRNRDQTRERMGQRRAEEKRTRAMREDPVGYLRGLKSQCAGVVCKTGSGGGVESTEKGSTVVDVCKTASGGAVLVGLVDYLVVRALFAKQEGLDGGPWRKVERGHDDARGAVLGHIGPSVCAAAGMPTGAGKEAHRLDGGGGSTKPGGGRAGGGGAVHRD